jgi:hypothetical protein
LAEINVPGPSAEWAASRDWETDPAASLEESQWDDLAKVKKRNELLAFKAVGLCIPILIVGAFLIFAVTVVIYTWHLLAPPSWHWLTADQITTIHGLIFSGAIGAAVAEGARRYLKNN